MVISASTIRARRERHDECSSMALLRRSARGSNAPERCQIKSEPISIGGRLLSETATAF